MRIQFTGRVAAFCFFWIASTALANQVGPGAHLINGTPVAAGTHQEVIYLTSLGAQCTGVVVGPQTIITAAHCTKTGQTATFTVGSTTYTATMTQSSLFPQQDHDIAIGMTTQPIQGVTPAIVGGTATTGTSITLLGYGCTTAGGGPVDGVLRIGNSVITGFSDFDMVSRQAGGAAICFVDTGGPAYIQDGTALKLIGINSKGNIQDTNYDIRTDIPETQTFLKTFATTNNVVVCGINSDCGNNPPPPAPTCTLTANPNSIALGATSTVSIVTTNATSATIQGQSVSVPTGQLPVTPTAAGVTTVQGTVQGANGTSGSCQTTLTVTNTPPPPPPPPTCTLTASPETTTIGDTVTLELDTQSTTATATIDGTSVSVPVGKTMVTTTVAGTFTVNGVVSNSAGTGNCSTSYTVTTTPPPPPNTPNFAIVPSYCGTNTLTTSVTRVCLAVVAKDATITDLRLTDALLISYNDGTTEVAPIITRKTEPPQTGDLRTIEDLTTYANAVINANTYVVLDTRAATLTSLPPTKDGTVPASLQGRTPKGVYFTVEQLTPFNVSKK